MQITKIINEEGDRKTDTDEIQGIIRIEFKNLKCTKLENVNEMSNFLNKYHLPKLNECQISNLNKPISPSETELRTLKFSQSPTQKKTYSQMFLAQNFAIFSRQSYCQKSLNYSKKRRRRNFSKVIL